MEYNGGFDVIDMAAEEIKRIISEKEFVIYGAGSVGKRFLKIIEKMGFRDKVIGFAVTEIDENQKNEGIPIRKIDRYDKTVLIMIAVHDVVYEEIKWTLQSKGYNNHIWIYPFFTELCYGAVSNTKMFQTSHIISKLDRIYSHVLIAMVIEECLDCNNVGIDIYKRYFEFFCNKDTARARTESLIGKIENALVNGFKQYGPIDMSRDMRVILDGAHRLMLAHYFGNKNVLVNIHECKSDDYYYLVNFSLTDSVLTRIFEPKQVQLIREMDQSLRGSL